MYSHYIINAISVSSARYCYTFQHFHCIYKTNDWTEMDFIAFHCTKCKSLNQWILLIHVRQRWKKLMKTAAQIPTIIWSSKRKRTFVLLHTVQFHARNEYEPIENGSLAMYCIYIRIHWMCRAAYLTRFI